MKIRFKFAKKGRLKYIGHLDLLNIWNRAIRTAELPVGYSKGFNPHMLVSFAAPLPLGLESVSEYVDITFPEGLRLEGICEKINPRFPEGLKALDAYVCGEPYRRVAAVVTEAEYTFLMPFDVSQAQIDGFLAERKIEIMKKTKRSNEIADIFPDIKRAKLRGSRVISAALSCGSQRNLKPALFIEAFCRFIQSGVPIYKIKITREEIFGENGFGQTAPLSRYNIEEEWQEAINNE